MDKDNKQQEFIDQYKDLEIPESTDQLTQWENRTSAFSVSPIVLNRYDKFLTTTNSILLGVFSLIVVVILGMSIKFLLFTKYEIIVFNDGTDVTCIFDPSTGEMKQNDR